MERSLTSLRIPSPHQEKDDNRNQLAKKEEENDQTDVEKRNDENTKGMLAKTVKPIIIILLFLIMLLLLAAGLAILLKKDTSSTSSQLTVSLTAQSSLKPQEEEYSTEATYSFQSSITSPVTDTESSTLRRPVAQGTTYFPDPPPRAGSRLLL